MGSIIKLFEDFKSEDFRKVRKYLIDGDYQSVKNLIKRSSEYIDRHSPPGVVEKEYKITGISYKYKIPFGLTEQELETISNEYMADEEVMKLILSELIKLNPTLKIFKNIPCKKSGCVRSARGYPISAVIGGSCSRMCADDIEDYLVKNTEILKIEGEYPNNIYYFNREKEYSELYNELYKKGIMIGYFPSINTLKKIKSQIES